MNAVVVTLSHSLCAAWAGALGQPLRYYLIFVAWEGRAVAYVVPFATGEVHRYRVIGAAMEKGVLGPDEGRYVVEVRRVDVAEYRSYHDRRRPRRAA